MKSKHLVICGWKQDMELILIDILRSNKHWTSQDIVIVAPVSNEIVAKVKENPKLKDLQVIQEDLFSEQALLRAGVLHAEKAMVLATNILQNESVAEIDAKTVIAAMSIEKLAHDVYLTVELLDPEFLPYLKMAHVDEVIYPHEYSRILLANSMQSAGIAHVVYQLLDVHSKTELTTVDIPVEYVGKTFQELREYFYSLNNSMICIGILENTDNVVNLKKQALVEAQKSTNIRAVIQSLEHVKKIEANIPHIIPPMEYQISATSMAIVVANREHPEVDLRIAT